MEYHISCFTAENPGSFSTSFADAETISRRRRNFARSYGKRYGIAPRVLLPAACRGRFVNLVDRASCISNVKSTRAEAPSTAELTGIRHMPYFHGARSQRRQGMSERKQFERPGGLYIAELAAF